MNPTAAIITACAAIFVGIIAGSVALWAKRLDRINETEKRHSEAREAGYNRLLAAGDAAWYYRSLKGVDPDAEDTDWASKLDAVSDLFESGVDKLLEYTRDRQALSRPVMTWAHVTTEDTQATPRQYEDAREALVDLKRQEIGLRKSISQNRELPFFERVRRGHIIQRLPEGVDSVVRFDDGSFMIMGAGGEFDETFKEFIHMTARLRESRAMARRRLAEWRKLEIWSEDPTEKEKAREGE